MNVFRLAIASGLLLVSTSCFASPADPPPAPQGTHIAEFQSAGLEVAVPPSISGTAWPIPRWQNGWLVFRQPTTIDPALPNLLAFEATGQEVFHYTVWAPGFAKLSLRGYAVSPGHSMAVAAAASSSPFSRRLFVEEISSSGAHLRTIDTATFEPALVAYDSTGDLWVAGEVSAGNSQTAEHNVLRRYHDGKLAWEGLPNSSFREAGLASDPLHFHPSENTNDGAAFLVPLKEGVGFWSAAAREWIEVAPDGGLTSRIQVRDFPPPVDGASAQITGLAATSAGDVIASFILGPEDQGVYVLDKAVGRWTPVKIANQFGGRAGYVAGAQGDSVVYRSPKKTEFLAATPARD
jgi:hypothetical protein